MGEEESIPVTKIQGSGSRSSNPFEDEKPLFHSNQRPPGPSVPFALSQDGVRVPYTINRYLRDYQREGIKFLYHSYAKGRGCILGDDMGLGKTIQVISFLAAVLHKSGTWKDVERNVPHFLLSQRSSEKSKVKEIFLIVAPLSVLYNWKDELDTWGHFRCVIVHGVRRDEELARLKRGRCEIALTTYETLRLCLDQFNSIDWAAVIVDEAHKLKNCKSQITQAMKEMKCKVRMGLTGTILQNNLEELWCVMDWAIPGCLGSLAGFKNRYADPIEQGQKHSATKRTLAVARKAVEMLAKKLSRFFLRRTKALISHQLPKKDDRVVYCSLTDFQRAVYQAVLDSNDVTMLLHSSDKCTCRSGRARRKCCFKTNADGVLVRHLYFSYLAILRKVANHVALLQSKEGTSKKQEKIVEDICKSVFQKFPEFTERCKQAAFEAMSDPVYSGKMKVLQRLLNHFVKRKDKVLLFSLSTKLLDILESYCMAEGLDYRRLDGNTKSKDRVKIVKEFNGSQDINLCLVSTMAGGLGLNFVGANIVVLFDPTWNPANDLQAIDRVYRIGQCRDVTVFRLISLGTVEEVIYLRQIYKQQLQSTVIGKENARRYFEAVQGAGDQAGELFGIRNLFRLQTEGTCLTHRILEREGQMEAGIMTLRTQAGEEKMPELDPDDSSRQASTEHSGRPLNGNQSATRFTRELLDFSSGSEDEEGLGSRSRPSEPGPGEEGGTGSNACGENMSLSTLLLRHGTQWPRADERSSSDEAEEGSDDESNAEKNFPTSRKERAQTGWAMSSESEEEPVGRPCKSEARDRPGPRTALLDHMEESEDIEVLTQAPRKRETGKKKDDKSQGAKHLTFRARKDEEEEEDNIESFTSSEDEISVKRMKPTGDALPAPKSKPSACDRSSNRDKSDVKQVGFTCVKSKTNPRGSDEHRSNQLPSMDTTDTLLGGLKEVSYTHSNQRVVGSSRAENRISRAALRDVFERQKYSQMPANHLLDSFETQPFGQELTQHQEGRKAPVTHKMLHQEHPATHTVNKTLQTPSHTVIIGETPSAICRKQLEEMAVFFGAASVQDFAEDLLRSTSEQRLDLLQRFYSQKNPELRDFITQTFSKPDPVTPPKDPNSPHSSSSSSRPRSASNPKPKPQSEDSSSAEEDQGTGSEIRRTESSRTRISPCRLTTNAVNGKTRTLSSSADSQRHQHKPPHYSYIGQEHRRQKNHTVVSEGQEPVAKPPLIRKPLKSQGHLAPSPSTSRAEDEKKKKRGEEKEEETASQTRSSLVTDLIGDTSILDDLFRPKGKPKEQSTVAATSLSLSQPAEKAKNRSKDFWDILNEGNEESISKLTDLSEVERICKSTSLAAKPKTDANVNSQQFWKKNEKFIWKKL
ncbi:DNA excision repair protein ERCC-6-like 2 [Chanos chanos]|uniref:DNA excision repair protein ERCC-6-like 2 n=1 Tax=Chanos chanos TaxID=29144 RepID=A0A6J2UN95_CHACN|nr:DNA excision repair protein ERCC-6-like 2 [Chanos chanos]